MTDAERLLWSRIRANQLGVRFRRQVPIGSFVLDFFCNSARLDVELDGSQHYTPDGMAKDQARDKLMRAHRIEILRFSDREVLTNLNGVLETIFDKVNEIRKTKPPEVAGDG